MPWIERRRAGRLCAAWHGHAAALYTALAAGGTPPVVPVPDQAGLGPVYLDAPITIAAFYGVDVVEAEPLWWPVPLAYPAAAWVNAWLARAHIRRLAERAHAAAAPQWRDHVPGRLLVSDHATWCQVRGGWQAYPHAALTGYWLDGDTAILDSPHWAPRALTGPAAWTHAVLLAWLRPPAPDWRDAAWLTSVRDHSARR